MAALARLQASSCTNPVLDVFTQVNGVLVDVYAVSFQIYDKTSGTGVQVYPATPGDKHDVDLDPCPDGDRLTQGRYVADWSVPGDANLGTFYIKWYIQLTSTSPVQTYAEEFEVLAEVVGAGNADANYCTILDLRNEGFTDTVKYTDAFLQGKINYASRLVEMYTGRFFYPKYMTITLDGKGGNKILLNDPIIAIESVQQLLAPYYDQEIYDLLEVGAYKIYNRHITQGLTDPDDRDNPRVELLNVYALRRYTHLHFLRGQQNIQIVGYFGYTDYDGTSKGKLPDMIRHVTKLLAVRNMNKLIYPIGPAPYRITSEQTRDQQVQYSPIIGQGNFSGDPEIDNILSMFLRPPALGAV